MEVTKEFRVVAGSDLLVNSPHGGIHTSKTEPVTVGNGAGRGFLLIPKR